MTTCYVGGMKTVNATEFKEKCLGLLDNLTNEGLVITKRGKPVAKVIPISSSCGSLIGSMRGKLKVKGDVLSTGLAWSAQSRRTNAKP